MQVDAVRTAAPRVTGIYKKNLLLLLLLEPHAAPQAKLILKSAPCYDLLVIRAVCSFVLQLHTLGLPVFGVVCDALRIRFHIITAVLHHKTYDSLPGLSERKVNRKKWIEKIKENHAIRGFYDF